uniref:deoxynucleotidyltransferase terminal-interacting protein 2-like n=1 Tax=Styela clava TaxID=7725 RepID=UPI00193965CD|nr:deoxynucleotidyltransferase terminal-interacting protein 2-like [Styela clava]
MVSTRSQNSPRKPSTPVRKKRPRKKLSDEIISDEDSDTELRVREDQIPSENLETINEENEEIEMSKNDDDIKTTVKFNDLRQKRLPQDDFSHTINKMPIKLLETITEETAHDDSGRVGAEIGADEIQVNIESSSSESVKVDSNDSSTKKKHRFHFPSSKLLVPANITPTSIDVGMEMQDTYIDVKSAKQGKKKIESLFAEVTVNKKDSQLKDSVITPDFETKLAIPSEKSLQQQRKERKEQQESSAGKDWFNMKPPEMTRDVKRDLEILRMRGVLDPKRFYKHNDRQTIPRYFQIGKVMDSPADFYSSRVPKKQRKPNLTEELLADAEFQQYQKRKYNEIQMKKKALGAKHRRMKRGKFSRRNKDD